MMKHCGGAVDRRARINHTGKPSVCRRQDRRHSGANTVCPRKVAHRSCEKCAGVSCGNEPEKLLSRRQCFKSANHRGITLFKECLRGAIVIGDLSRSIQNLNTRGVECKLGAQSLQLFFVSRKQKCKA